MSDFLKKTPLSKFHLLRGCPTNYMKRNLLIFLFHEFSRDRFAVTDVVDNVITRRQL